MTKIVENENVRELIRELEKRKDQGILEENNYLFLLNLLSKADNVEEAIDICKLGTTYYKSGLKYEKKLEVKSDSLKYFEKDNELSIDQGGIHHKLIIGDNYYALLNLLVEYKNSIDIIYIDPPYGTNSMGEFARTNYKNRLDRDNLLSMMWSRLVVARQLMSDSGIILCSIDDKNYAYLKCLFDDVFGESNFVASFCRNTTNSHSGSDHTISSQVDYVLFYCKEQSYKDTFIQVIKTDYIFPEEDSNGKYKLGDFLRSGNHDTNLSRPNCYYPIYVSKDLKDISLEKKAGYIEVLPPEISPGVSRRWRWGNKWNETKYSPDNYKFNKDSELTKTNINLLVAVKNSSGNIEIKYKHYDWDTCDNKKTFKTAPYGNILENVLNAEGTIVCKEILDTKAFSNPKPVKLLCDLLERTYYDSEIILDFFGGSGTTGHSVLEWNRNKKDDKEFIIVQLDEDLEKGLENADSDSKEIAMNALKLAKEMKLPLDLSSITYERLKRIMTGKDSLGNSNFKWLNKNKSYGDSLDVIRLKSSAVNDIKIFEKIDETLYGQKAFETKKDKIEWVCKNFEKVAKELKDA